MTTVITLEMIKEGEEAFRKNYPRVRDIENAFPHNVFYKINLDFVESIFRDILKRDPTAGDYQMLACDFSAKIREPATALLLELLTKQQNNY